MVNVGTGGIGTRFIRTEYPVTEGLVAGTTKLKEDWVLEADESVVPEQEKVGL